ncbi:MAG: acyl-ACP--UDP-N-acetylglucosamine O-acyltransferase [Pirellulales bacterium]|nr:acyl-ACP--UDP-N-acetylglucosamine O-acyltransferase [Pirellulales bacterium]
MNIHPSAVVSRKAKIGLNVTIGPLCVIEDDVVIGDDCTLASHVVIKNGITIGSGNRIFESAVLGGYPQHINMPENPGTVTIGSGNTIRENVTIHRALNSDKKTVVGNNNLFMVNTHVAHDCVLGNNIIMTNNAMLGGHVVVEDRAFISGAVAVHQFCRVGSMAMVGGQAHIIQDVPPFVTVDGLSSLVVGLNTIGLRRSGYDANQIRILKEAYRVIYRSGLSWNEILDRLQVEFSDTPAAHFHKALSMTTRGIISERRLPPGATLKLHRESGKTQKPQVRVG